MPFIRISVDPGEKPLSLFYSLHYEVSRNDIADAYTDGDKHFVVPGTDIAYAIRPAYPKRNKPQRLWITGKEIKFTGRVVNQGDSDDLKGWKAGFVQSIYRSERNGHYENGRERRLKLDVSYGPLMDGNWAPFYGQPEGLDGGSATIIESDGPNFVLPDVDGSTGDKLLRTSGTDDFGTFLVLARESDKTMIALSRVSWSIDWAGTYRHGDSHRPWVSEDPGEFFRTRQDDQPQVYSKMHQNPRHAPFSLLMTEAEEFCKTLVNGEWKGCSMGGDTSKPGTMRLNSWRTAS